MQSIEPGSVWLPSSQDVQVFEVRFVHVGHRVINLNQVCSVTNKDGRVVVSFADGRQESFADLEADALRAFFFKNAINVFDIT